MKSIYFDQIHIYLNQFSQLEVFIIKLSATNYDNLHLRRKLVRESIQKVCV